MTIEQELVDIGFLTPSTTFSVVEALLLFAAVLPQRIQGLAVAR